MSHNNLPKKSVAPEFNVSNGAWGDLSILHRNGKNVDADTGTIEDIWTRGGTRVYLTATATVDIFSSDAADNITGSGARSVTVSGLDSNWDMVSEKINLNGTTTANGTQGFIRVNGAEVTEAGTYSDSNKGTITLNDSVGNAQGEIVFGDGLGRGRTAISHFSVPRTHSILIHEITLAIEANKISSFFLMSRENADVTTTANAFWLQQEFPNISGNNKFVFSYPVYFPEKTDVVWRVLASANNTQVAVHYHGVLSKNI